MLDLVTVWFIRGFATKPIYVFGGAAMLLFLGACLCSVFVLYQRFFNAIFVKDQPLFIVGMVMAIMSVQFVAMGLLAELLVRTYFESRNKPAYHIRTTAGWPTSTAGVEVPIAPKLEVFVSPGVSESRRELV